MVEVENELVSQLNNFSYCGSNALEVIKINVIFAILKAFISNFKTNVIFAIMDKSSFCYQNNL